MPPQSAHDPKRRSLLTAALAAPTLAFAPRLARSAPADTVLVGARVLARPGDDASAHRLDVHVRDGAIVAVASAIDVPGATRIDLADHLLMPGLVDTHWHQWNTVARGLASSAAGPFAKTMAALAKVWTPEASALGVRLATAEAIAAGITTVHNWAHNTVSTEFADAELDAQQASGVRGRFAYGYPQAIAPDTPMDLKALEAFVRRRFRDDAALVRPGVCVRGPDRCAPDVWRGESDGVRALKLPLSAHVASDRAAGAMGHLAKMHAEGRLGPDVQIVHGTHASADDFRRMKEAGSPLSLSPWTELEVGYGLPPLATIAASGVNVGLSVDNMVLAGHADLFGVMRVTSDLAAGVAEKQNAIPDATLLRWATVDGARSLGFERVGAIAPGWRADLIAIRTDRLHTSPVASDTALLTHVVRPDDVALVMIDGVVKKRDGRLVDVDTAALVDASRTTISLLRARAGV